MAWTPPTKYLKQPELLDEKRFYRLLSEQSNYINPELALVFYAGLVCLIGEELRQHKFCRLPHLGDFALVEQKPRPAWMGRLHAVIGTRQVLKFYPKEYLRRRFNKRQGFPRYTEILPAPFIK